MTARSETADVLDDVRARHSALLDEKRPAAVEKQHARGSLTARERIALLLDPGTEFVEYGALARPRDRSLEAPAEGVVVGLGRVHGRPAVVFSYDFTVLGGSQGPNTHVKTTRAAALARRFNAPLFMLCEGGGARTQELAGFGGGGHSLDFEEIAHLSGKVPLVGLAFGRSFAGHAIFLGEADVVIAVKTAVIGIAGPPLVKASTGQDLTPEEIGAVSIHAAAGAAELVVEDDAAAIATARAYTRYLVEPVSARDDADRADRLRETALSPWPFDMHDVVHALVDDGTSLELRATWAPGVVTALARLGGHSVAVLATNGAAAGGALTSDGCDKIARFLYFADAFRLPVVVLVDSAGPVTGEEALEAGELALARHAARIPLAVSTLTVPVCTVVVGRCHGLAQVLIGALGRVPEQAIHLCWPTAAYTGLGIPENDPAESAFAVAAAVMTDDVIDPGNTRTALTAVIEASKQPPIGQGRRYIDLW